MSPPVRVLPAPDSFLFYSTSPATSPRARASSAVPDTAVARLPPPNIKVHCMHTLLHRPPGKRQAGIRYTGWRSFLPMWFIEPTPPEPASFGDHSTTRVSVAGNAPLLTPVLPGFWDDSRRGSPVRCWLAAHGGSGMSWPARFFVG